MVFSVNMRAIFFIILGIFPASLLGLCKEKGKTAVYLESHENQREREMIDTMKIRDIILLVKYAQGGVVYNSFLDYLLHIRPAERRYFLSQTAELIKKLGPQDLDVSIAIEKNALGVDYRQYHILNEGTIDQKLAELLKLQDENFEDAFKIVLALFTEGYKRAYAKKGKDTSKFWYWDYSLAATAFRVVELEVMQEVDIRSLEW